MEPTNYYQTILEEIYNELKPRFGEGAVANYIPALAKVEPSRFGIAISTLDGTDYSVGDAEEPFPIQSISKVFNLILALRLGESSEIWNRVGVEPSGNSFNSLSQLEYENGKPRNPFINAGALVVTDCIISHSDSPIDSFLAFAQTLSEDSSVKYDKDIFQSEWEFGHRNAAVVHYLYSFDNIKNDIDLVLRTYFHQCALSMSCTQLAKAFRFLANEGRVSGSTEPIITSKQARRVNSLMMTCGTYDEAGEFAFHVGLPCKSGVGGGIVAIVPGQMTICVWSPGLGSRGNSVLGMQALKLFCQKTGIAIF